MGLGGISIWQLLIILVIVILIFGTKKLPKLGSDLGGALKGFKDSMDDESKNDDQEKIKEPKAASAAEQTATSQEAEDKSTSS